MSDQALRPAFTLKEFMKPVEDTREPSVDEQILARGSETKFWSLVRKHFDNAVEQLEQINEQAIAGGAPFDEIGRNALVISQVKGVLRKIINGVEDAKEALDGETK